MKTKPLIIIGFGIWISGLLFFSQSADISILNSYTRLAPHIDKAKSAFDKGNFQKCRQEIDYCLERLSDHHEANFLLAQVLYRNGDYEQALEKILLAEKGFLHQNDVLQKFKRAKLEKQMDSEAQAVDDVVVLKDALEAAKTRGSCKVGELSKALHDSSEKTASGGKNTIGGADDSDGLIPAGYHYFHGNCLFRLKRLPEAEAKYLQVIRTDSQFKDVYNNLINILYVSKRLDEARSFLAMAEKNKAPISPGLKKALLESVDK